MFNKSVKLSYVNIFAQQRMVSYADGGERVSGTGTPNEKKIPAV